MAMADWQRRVWQDIVAVDGVMPAAGGRILIVGEGLPVLLTDDVLYVERRWGEAVSEDIRYDRIILLAHGYVEIDFAVALEQMWRLLRPDGLLVVVAARPSPWGLRRTVWWRGRTMVTWRRWLRAANWLIADELTVGFCAVWARYVPWGGPLRLILAQKRVGGTKILVQGKAGVMARPVGIPV